MFGGGGFISTSSELVKMAQATYGKGYLSEKARLALKTPTKLREGQVNKKQYSLGW